MIGKYLAGTKRKTGKTREFAVTADAPDWFTRVTDAYMKKPDPPIVGSARNSAFSLSGHLHSFLGEDGTRLSDQQVFNYLVDWNFRGGNVMRGSELQEATVNGRTNGTMPADKIVNEFMSNDDSDIDLSGIMESIKVTNDDDDDDDTSGSINPG